MFIQTSIIVLLVVSVKGENPCKLEDTAADCTGKGLKTIPDLENPEDITSLDLSDNKLEELGDQAFSKFTLLEKLTIDSNKINQVNQSAFEGCTKLKSLSMKSNKIPTLPEDVFNETIIEELNLADNAFSALPVAALKNMTTLKTVDLQNLAGDGLLDDRTRFTLAGTFEQSASLKKLVLSENKIRSFGVEPFKGLSALEDLDISNNELSDLPPFCGDLAKLTTLSMNGFKGKVIPDNTFTKCDNAVTITMSESMVEDIGTAFSNLPKLTTLELPNNLNLVLTSDDAFKGTSLTDLNLNGMSRSSSYNFYTLPTAIRNLQSQKNVTDITLDISFSRYTVFSIEDMKFFDKIKELKAVGNPYDCTCRNEPFIIWLQGRPSAIKTEELKDYKCATCDYCETLPTPVSTFDLKHCEPEPKPKPKPPPTPKPGKSVAKYAAGMTFLGILIGVVMTSCVVFYMMRSRRACFRSTPYADLDRPT